jgi:thiol-disulfide isomerase/thioredoxin
MDKAETSLYKGTSVRELSPKDFKIDGTRTPTLLLKKDGFLMCYAIWCPHCRNKVDMWSSLASELKNTNFVIAALDCVKYKEISNALGITGIPRVFYFNKAGKLEDYTQEIVPNALLNYACDTKNLLCEKRKRR